MRDTSLQLSSARTEYLLKLLDAVPIKDRNVVHNDVFNDVKKIYDIWKIIISDQQVQLGIKQPPAKQSKPPVKPPAKLPIKPATPPAKAK